MRGTRLTRSAAAQTCCPGTLSNCERQKLVEVGNCFCPPYNSSSVEVDLTCTDAEAACLKSRSQTSDCGSGETYHTCTIFFLDSCCTEDRDGDGYYAASCGGDDCDDSPETGYNVNPGQDEGADEAQCYDHVDNDCADTPDHLDRRMAQV
jgi:hypothetical protein